VLILRKYQLDIIFLYFALSLIIWLWFYFTQYLGSDPHDYEWIIVGPLIFFYIFHLARIRSTIAIADRRALTAKTLLYWIAFGIILFANHLTPLAASEYWSIDLLFIIFTVFLADSYWDFKKLTLKSILKK